MEMVHMVTESVRMRKRRERRVIASLLKGTCIHSLFRDKLPLFSGKEMSDEHLDEAGGHSDADEWSDEDGDEDALRETLALESDNKAVVDKEVVFFKLEAMGYRVGFCLAERFVCCHSDVSYSYYFYSYNDNTVLLLMADMQKNGRASMGPWKS